MYKIHRKIPIQSQQQLSKDHIFELSKSHLLEKFVCFIMKNGKKNKAYKILYKTLNIIKNQIAQSKNRSPGLGRDVSSIFSNFLTERAFVNVSKSLVSEVKALRTLRATCGPKSPNRGRAMQAR